MKKIIGISMLVLVFGAVFVMLFYMIGWFTLLAFAATFFLYWFVSKAIDLIGE